MLLELILFTVTVFLTFVLYKFYSVDRKYYERRNIKYVSQLASLINIFKMVLNQFTPIEMAQGSYDAFPNEPIYGIVFGPPQYVLRDPEIIKQIAIKDFDYFEDHQSFADEKIDKLWGNSLFLMKGQKWRHMRATLSPAFTGSKMRQMYGLVSECTETVVKFLKSKTEHGEKLNIEMKDLFTRYTNDVIASCAFGLKIDSLAQPDNEFYLDGKQLSNFTSPLAMMKGFLILFLPKVAQFFNVSFSSSSKFKGMVMDMIKFREENNISRPDMINIMMQVRNGSLKYQSGEESIESAEGFATAAESEVGKVSVDHRWNDDEIVAQCFLFFVAGFETTSTTLTFAAYELVANPDVQQKLCNEIAETNKQLDSKQINYDVLQKMKYLDQFICEVLRKWPPLLQPDRVCVKDYILDDGHNIKFKIEKGSQLLIQAFGIHHDQKYYPNPEKFDPNRFSDENKNSILRETYLPFGIGPRNCIGSRFALMEIKVILYHLLLNFSFEANEQTDIPFKLKKSAFNFAMKNGMNLELKPRSN